MATIGIIISMLKMIRKKLMAKTEMMRINVSLKLIRVNKEMTNKTMKMLQILVITTMNMVKGMKEDKIMYLNGLNDLDTLYFLL